MNDYAERLSDLTHEQRAFLERRLQERTHNGNTELPITPRSSERPSPLSFSQNRFWFLHQLDPAQSLYHVQNLNYLDGVLDIPTLEKSLRTIIQRHEAIRTTFVVCDGVPLQVVQSDFDFKLSLVDYTDLLKKEKQPATMELAASEFRHPFDLTQDLMLRATLMKLAPREHWLAITSHHIASDAWSSGIFLRELSIIYQAFIAGEPNPLPHLPIQYADYAAWQRRWLEGARLEQQMAYWHEQLVDLPTLDLPTDRPRPPQQSHRGAIIYFKLPRDLLSQLHELSQQENASLFMTLLAAYSLLLKRYTRQDDFAVGTLVANRRRPEIESLIGLFINTLVMRIDLSDDPTFRQLLNRVKQVALDAYDHQDIPFELLLEKLQPPRDLSQTPLIQSLLVLQNAPRKAFNLREVTIRRTRLPTQTSKLDLSLYLEESAGELLGRLEYCTDLFEVTTIERLSSHFRTLLEEIVANPDQPIAQIPMLPPAEHNMLVKGWNLTDFDDSNLPNLVNQFYVQVAQKSEGTAYICQGKHLTFTLLNKRSNQLAHYLIRRGIKPGMRVGLALERSLDAPLALLAIFKTGGVYVPLDPAYPMERLSFIVQDSDLRFVLTTSQWQERFTPTEGEDGKQLQILCLDRLAGDLSAASVDDITSSTDPGQTAYIIYTSGSTGKPKGIEVSYRQILNRLAWMWETYPFRSDEIGCQKTALTFVDSLWELLGYLLQGLPTVIIPDKIVKDPFLLVEALGEAGVTRLWMVPSLMRAILDTQLDLRVRLPQLSFWVSSGEALPADLARRFKERMLQAGLHNLYGTSEIWDGTWHDLSREETLINGPTVPIGRPIGNMRAYIVDEAQNISPLGVPGELWVSGTGLADGYVNQPDLTSERFLENPFALEGNQTPGLINEHSRIYRTGDLAKRLPDGTIEYLGRIDRQLKVRGMRIEPEEIEARLRQHESVQDAVAVAQGSGNNLRLVAYVVAANQCEVQPGGLREYLTEWLPAVMVPWQVVEVETLPLTSSGKVDRKILAKLPLTPYNLAAYTAPRTKKEKALADIWAEVLNVEKVGVDDNFFELGGHSLLSVQLFARIEEVFNRRLPVALLFRAQTVSQMIPYLQEAQGQDEWLTLVPIQKQGTRQPFFCVHGFGGGVVGYAALANLMGTEQPFYGLQAAGLNGQDAPDASVEEMAVRYIAAIREVQEQGPYRVGGYCLGGVVAFEIARQFEADGEEVELLAIMEGYAPARYHQRSRALAWDRWLTVWHNVPYWMEDYWSLGLEGFRIRLASKVRRWSKRIMKKLGAEVEVNAQDILPNDLSTVPEHHRQLMEVQLRAIRNYTPRPYGGTVTLFSAKGRTISKAFFGSGDSEHGWGALAQAGVKIRVVHGGHRNIHLPPNAPSLAAALDESLQGVDPVEHDQRNK